MKNYLQKRISGEILTKAEAYLKDKIESVGICFLHAPLFHPAMRFV